MAKEKITLRGILKSVKKYNEALVFSDKECFSYAEILKKTGIRQNGETLLSDLKQLEERIEEIKNEEQGPNFLARATVSEVIDEILGEK